VAIGCLVVVALTSPAESRSVLHTLFGPPKIQTRSPAYTLPGFLRALFSPLPQPRRRIAGARARPALAARPAPRLMTARLVPKLMSARVAAARSHADDEGRPDPAPMTRIRGRTAMGAEPDPAPVEEGIAGAFLRDRTLKRGDIVVFPDGPRVFTGGRRNTLRDMSDFEELEASALVSEQTRQEVMAATETVREEEPRLSFTARPGRPFIEQVSARR
jgi:hypothetical protein